MTTNDGGVASRLWLLSCVLFLFLVLTHLGELGGGGGLSM
jgi:hypothetical protein